MIWQSCSLPIPHKNFWDEREVVLPLILRIWDRPQWEACSPASPLPQRRMVDRMTGLERALSFLPVPKWHSRVCKIPMPQIPRETQELADRENYSPDGLTVQSAEFWDRPEIPIYLCLPCVFLSAWVRLAFANMIKFDNCDQIILWQRRR